MWIFLAVLCAVAASFSHWKLTELALAYSSYYILAAIVVGYVVLAVRAYRKPSRETVIGLGSAIVLALIAFLSVKVDFKILLDEAMVLCTSKSFAFQKSAYCVTEAKRYYNLMFPIDYVIDKRPFLFPFLASLLHTLLGYRPENVFAINFGAFVLLLFSVHQILKRYIGVVGAMAGQVLVLSQPVLSMSATSGALEMLNLALFVFGFVLLIKIYIDGETRLLPLFLAHLLLFCHSRYESPLFAILLAAPLFPKIKSLLTNRRWIWASLVLIAFAPIGWQRLLKATDHETMPNVQPFAIENFLKNLSQYFWGQVGSGFQYTYAPFVNVFGWVVLSLVLVALWKRKKRLLHIPDKMILGVGFIAFFAHLLIYLSYHFSDYSHPAAARYFLFPTLVLAVVPLLAQSFAFPGKVSAKTLLLYAFAIFFLYHPIAVEGQATQSLFYGRQYRFTRDFLEKYAHRDHLIISERPVMYTVLDYGAISPKYANENAENLREMFDRHLFREVLVIQRMEYETGRAKAGQVLREEYPLETLVELQNNENEYLRISKVLWNVGKPSSQRLTVLPTR